MTKEKYLEIMAELVRPCHSIHCRHYDLSDGRMCQVEFERLKDMHARGEWPALTPTLNPAWRT